MNTTGIVILESSFPIHCFSTDHSEKSLRWNCSAGRLLLWVQKGREAFSDARLRDEGDLVMLRLRDKGDLVTLDSKVIYASFSDSCQSHISLHISSTKMLLLFPISFLPCLLPYSPPPSTSSFHLLPQSPPAVQTNLHSKPTQSIRPTAEAEGYG